MSKSPRFGNGSGSQGLPMTKPSPKLDHASPPQPPSAVKASHALCSTRCSMRLAIAVLCLTVAACAPRPETANEASNGEVQGAIADQDRCFADATKNLDDGRSDAGTVAEAVVASCRAQNNQVYRAFVRGHERIGGEMSEALTKRFRERALQYVLTWRNMAQRQRAQLR
jgi:hypothetical protein